MGNLTIWLTPVWVLSAGITAGIAVLALAWAVQWLVGRRTAEAVIRLVRESILLWISYVAFVFIAFFLLAMPVMPVKPVLHSLARLPKVGTSSTSVTIPARKDDVELPVNFESDELQSYTLKSDQDLVVG